ncbi:MAG: cytochrome-c peroxidase [Thiothrix sp.]|nr:MAG: cytochrome-c peroxidase [Thiothrix sp.]
MNNKYTLSLGFAIALSTYASTIHAAYSIDTELRSLISQHNLSGDPSRGRVIPNINSPKAQLGMRLFFNKALGGNKDTACVSCHHPLLGGGDDLALSIGIGAVNPDLLGSGRLQLSGHPNVPRNAPTTFNMSLWDAAIFWDGRIESLAKQPGMNGSVGGIRTPNTSLGVSDPQAGANLVAAQAKFPVTSHAEMRGDLAGTMANTYVWTHLAGRLGGFGEGAGELPQPEYWLNLFKQVYGTPTSQAEQVITTQNVFDAIGEYERSQTFTHNPWQAYIRGNTQALSESAKRGALLFYKPYQQGGGNCVACHKGDTFTDEKFYNLAMPQLGKGERGGADNTHDYGRGNETKLYADRFTFRTPSLLNVEGTKPYSHAGAYYTLEAVIQHHLDPAWAVANYQPNRVKAENPGIQTETMQKNTFEALYKLREDQQKGLNPLRTARLSKTSIEDLANFLRALTDPCIKSATCLAPWLPPLHEDPNGLQLEAQFKF